MHILNHHAQSTILFSHSVDDIDISRWQRPKNPLSAIDIHQSQLEGRRTDTAVLQSESCVT